MTGFENWSIDDLNGNWKLIIGHSDEVAKIYRKKGVCPNHKTSLVMSRSFPTATAGGRRVATSMHGGDMRRVRG